MPFAAMSAKPFAPRPLRTGLDEPDSDLARALEALEVADCSCWRTYWSEYCRQVRAGEYDGEKPVPPPPLCEHILERDSQIEIDAWEALQRGYDPEGYGDPPTPPEPRVFLTWSDAASVYAERTRAGYAMYHPGDVFSLERVSVEAMKGRKQGGLR